jgi:DNA-binding LacI/PurR family transcriptional regulator
MADIALRAGVSRATVSSVLNGSNSNIRVSEETRERILAVADEMGYRPNEIARAMISGGKQRVIAYLAKNPEKEFRARILTGVLAAAEEWGYFVQVMRLYGRELDAELIKRCLSLRPSGILVQLIAPTSLEYLHNEMSRWEIPIVLLDAAVGAEKLDRVMSDEWQGAWEAVRYLSELGHRRIAFISGVATDPVCILREAAFRQAMHQHGLPLLPGFLQHGDWEIQPTERAVEYFLNHVGEPPTAIFCANDVMAMLVLRYARRLGYPVPDRLSVIGYGDFSSSAYTDPALTSVAQPFAEMGYQAMRCLLTRIANMGEGSGVAPRELLHPCQLVIRESCRPVNSPLETGVVARMEP